MVMIAFFASQPTQLLLSSWEPVALTCNFLALLLQPVCNYYKNNLKLENVLKDVPIRIQSHIPVVGYSINVGSYRLAYDSISLNYSGVALAYNRPINS